MLTALCTTIDKLARVFYYLAIVIILLSQGVAYFTPNDTVRIVAGLVSGITAAVTFFITCYFGFTRAGFWLVIVTPLLINIILPIIEIIVRCK